MRTILLHTYLASQHHSYYYLDLTSYATPQLSRVTKPSIILLPKQCSLRDQKDLGHHLQCMLVLRVEVRV